MYNKQLIQQQYNDEFNKIVSDKHEAPAAPAYDVKPKSLTCVAFCSDAKVSKKSTKDPKSSGSTMSDLEPAPSYNMKVQIGSFKNCIPFDKTFISPDGDTAFLPLRVANPAIFKGTNKKLMLPVSPCSHKPIEFIAINKDDTRMMFTNYDQVVKNSGEVIYVINIDAAYGLKKPDPNFENGGNAPATTIQTPAAAPPAPVYAPIIVNQRKAITAPASPPQPPPSSTITTTTTTTDTALVVIAPPQEQQLVPRNDTVNVYPPVLTGIYKTLGFVYNPTIASKMMTVPKEMLDRYYNATETSNYSAFPRETAMSLELEHPEIIKTPIAAENNMCAKITWTSYGNSSPVIRIDSVDTTPDLVDKIDDEECLWPLHEIIDSSRSIEEVFRRVGPRRFKFVHRPTDEILDKKLDLVGPQTLQIFKVPCSHRPSNNPGDPWTTQPFDKNGVQKDINSHMSGQVICQTWGPGEVADDKTMRECIVLFECYEQLISKSFGITDPQIWSHLASIITKNMLLIFECTLNLEKTLRIDDMHKSWSAVKEKFSCAVDIMRISVVATPFADKIGEAITPFDAVEKKLKSQPITQDYIERCKRERTKNVDQEMPFNVMHLKTDSDRIAHAAADGCIFRHVAVETKSAARKDYILAFRPLPASRGDPAGDAKDTGVNKNRANKDRLNVDIMEHGGFYGSDGREIFVDEVDLVSRCEQRGVLSSLPAKKHKPAAEEEEKVEHSNNAKEMDQCGSDE